MLFRCCSQQKPHEIKRLIWKLFCSHQNTISNVNFKNHSTSILYTFWGLKIVYNLNHWKTRMKTLGWLMHHFWELKIFLHLELHQKCLIRKTWPQKTLISAASFSANMFVPLMTPRGRCINIYVNNELLGNNKYVNIWRQQPKQIANIKNTNKEHLFRVRRQGLPAKKIVLFGQ